MLVGDSDCEIEDPRNAVRGRLFQAETKENTKLLKWKKVRSPEMTGRKSAHSECCKKRE